MGWLPFILSTITHAIVILCVIGILRAFAFKRMPVFFAYLVFEEVVFLVLLTIVILQLHGHRGLGPLYQWVAVVGSVGISSCLQLAVYYEIASTLILPHSPILTTLRPLIRWATAGTILLAAGVSAAFSGMGLRPLTHIFEVLNFSANLVNLSLLLVLFLFTRTFHISWKSLPAGAALGFGITSSTEMGATGFISAFGTHGIIPSDMVRTLGFLACTLVWLVYILLPEDGSQFNGQGVRKSEIETWQDELHKIVNQ